MATVRAVGYATGTLDLDNGVRIEAASIVHELMSR